MPLYDYKCAKCQKVTEVRHGFDATYTEPCAACGGELQRVFNPAPIVFKGSGFYVTDSRGKPSESKPTSESKPAAETPSTKSESKPDSPSKSKESAA